MEPIAIANNALGDPKDLMNFGYWADSVEYAAANVAIYTCHTGFNPAKKVAICDDLTQLVQDDEIIVELNSGKKLTYQVRATKTVLHTEVDMKEFITAPDPTKLALSIMTCTGKYNKEDGASHRLLIRASLKS
jgi:sortase (surface protein transpeptidase)